MKIPSNKRKQAKEALLEHGRKLNEQYTELESIYSTSPMGMCFMDTDLRYLRCNETLAEINGIPAADHIGRTLREIVPEIAETMEPVYRRIIETGEPVIDVEASMTAGTDSHKKRYFSACYYPVISEDGVVRGVSSIIQEITARVEVEKSLEEAYEQLENRVQKRTKELTKANVKLKDEIAERKKAEKLSKDSEARFRMIYENAPVLVDAFDENGRCIMFNKECEKVFGWTAEEIISHENPLMLFYPDPEVQRQVVESVTSKPDRVFREWKPIRKDGSEVLCLWANFKLPDGIVINIGYDITEREMEHNALLENEHRLRQLVESTNAIPWEADAKTWQFIYIGPQAVKLFGFSIEQWREKDFWIDHIHPDDRDYAINYCLESSQHYNEFEFDYRMIMANGSVVWLHDIVNVERKNGELDKLRGFMIDITERKNAEENLRNAENEASIHRERLAHLIRVQTLGEMASGIAHEINQPLAAIEIYTQASQKHLHTGKANHGKLEELLGKISDQAKRAGSIVSGLRAMMQHRTVNPTAIDINTLLEEVTKIAKIDCKNLDCRLIFKLNPSLPSVIGDEIQIQQVVLNLIRNAIDALSDFTDELEKEIVIETKINDNKEVEISVSDNGSGISELDAGNIFEAFYTTKNSGLGMGLSICRNIINAHGGAIAYSQGEAGGATFYFTLPIENEKV